MNLYCRQGRNSKSVWTSIFQALWITSGDQTRKHTSYYQLSVPISHSGCDYPPTSNNAPTHSARSPHDVGLEIPPHPPDNAAHDPNYPRPRVSTAPLGP